MNSSQVLVAVTVPQDDGVDVTLIWWMLTLTPSEGLDLLQGFADSCAEPCGEIPATLS